LAEIKSSDSNSNVTAVVIVGGLYNEQKLCPYCHFAKYIRNLNFKHVEIFFSPTFVFYILDAHKSLENNVTGRWRRLHKVDLLTE